MTGVANEGKALEVDIDGGEGMLWYANYSSLGWSPAERTLLCNRRRRSLREGTL